VRALLIRNAYQKDTGGAEQYAFNLALALKNEHITPIVVTKHQDIVDRCRKAKIASIRGVWYEKQEWDRFYYIRRLYTTLWYVWIILSRRIDVVHPQSRDDFVFATAAAKLCRKPVIWTDHADLKYILDRVNHPHPRMQNWILRAASYASRILCVSHSEHESISKVAPEIVNKLSVVYNGVFTPSGLRPVTTDKFVIGTNARLVPAKGIAELIEAFATSTKKPAELWLLGGYSNNLKKYQLLAKDLGVDTRIRFIGYVHNPNDYVASMNIFVHASYHEAFSLAIIEAAMLGKTIIATNVGGTPEIIQNNKTGLLIEPKSSRQISSALQTLLHDQELGDRLAKNAQERARAEFDFQQIVHDKIVTLYKEIVL
jgi:glycosyltransferase involved in cell wall biosynthesis